MNSTQDRADYSLISNKSSEDENNEKVRYETFGSSRPRSLVMLLYVSIIVVILAGLILCSYIILSWNPHAFGRPSTSCSSPPMRREWRSLSKVESLAYIEAVRCLRNTPSRLNLNHSLYDDFPWVHQNYGAYSHGAAPFLAWHRYFIHLYERALREDCGFHGHLTYWDWMLDWEDITKAPVWNNVTGFGGNGNPNNASDIGFCVLEGPFADLEIPYIRADFKPHCLSRDFADKKSLTRLGQDIRPAVIEKLLSYSDYDSFNIGLEATAHNSIPNSVGGDFEIFTAPSDPVFFLHHTQLDRIWWKWQQIEPSTRFGMYKGKAAHGSKYEATLSDIIPMGGLAPDIKVSDILNTVSGMLCYRY